MFMVTCASEEMAWNLPHTNPLDPLLNPSGTQPFTDNPLILSNTAVILRGHLIPFSPEFTGDVVVEWQPTGEDWTRIQGTLNALGIFEAQLANLTPGGTYQAQLVMLLGDIEVFATAVEFTLPLEEVMLGCTDDSACNFDETATFNDGSCTYPQTYWVDMDGDGFGDDSSSPNTECPPLPKNAVFNAEDCNDNNGNMYPNAPSTQEGIDNDCSGSVEADEETPPIDLPAVTTNSPNSITSSGATGSGNVTDSGGASVTGRGLVVGLSNSPTLDNMVFEAGSGTGFFTANLDGLESSTVYHVRAFATNAGGTSYGANQTFETAAPEPMLVDQWNCESMANVTSSFTYWDFSSYETAPWVVASGGYSGSCWRAPDPSVTSTISGGDHYVEFEFTFANNGFLEFWTNSSNPGSPNVIPTFYVDGFSMEPSTMIDGSTSGFEWMKLRTTEIPSGTHTLKFEFNPNYYVYSVDEIEFFEYPE